MIFIRLHRFGSSWPMWEPVWPSLSFQVSHQVGRKARLDAALHSKLHFFLKKAGKASVGDESLPGASTCKLWQERREQRCWERVTGKASCTTRQALYSQERLKVKRRKLFKALWKDKTKLLRVSLKTHDFSIRPPASCTRPDIRTPPDAWGANEGHHTAVDLSVHTAIP